MYLFSRNLVESLTTDWMTGGSIPFKGEGSFILSLCVQISSEAHSAPCTMSTGSQFPGVNHGWNLP
jgi:hypothetical protein